MKQHAEQPSDVMVTCRLTPTDIQAVHNAIYQPAWGAQHWGRFEGLRRVFAGILLTGFIVLALKVFARNKLGADIVGWDIVASTMFGGAVLGAWWARQNTTVPEAGSLIYQPFMLSLETRGFRICGEGFDNYTGWDQVVSLREAGGCLLIDTRLGSTHFVPRSAFASPDAADAYFARITVLRETVVNSPARASQESVQ